MRLIQRTAVAERNGLLWDAGHLPRRETININSFRKDSVALTGLVGFLPFTQGVARGLALPLYHLSGFQPFKSASGSGSRLCVLAALRYISQFTRSPTHQIRSHPTRRAGAGV